VLQRLHQMEWFEVLCVLQRLHQMESITPNGKFAYVTELVNNRVAVINTSTNAVVATVPVGHSPGEVAIAPDGALAYVATGTDGLWVIRTATNRVVAKAPLVTYGLAISSRATPPTTTTTSAPSSTTLPRSTSTSTTVGSSTTVGPGTTTPGQSPELPVTGSAAFPEIVLGLALVTSGALMTRRPRRTP
jgi:YVTN family beta-propeller protein